MVISGVLFIYRFYLLQTRPSEALARHLRILPHVNDTLLLTAAIGMLIVLRINPFQLAWLNVKLLLLPVYIVLGALCMRATAGSMRQRSYFGLAISVYASMVTMALLKYSFI